MEWSSPLQAFGSGASSDRPGAVQGTRAGEATVFRRVEQPRGPLTVFGYDYFSEDAESAGIPKPGLLTYDGEWGSGEEYAYEALNLANGKRTAEQICTLLSFEYGQVPPQ